MYVKLLRDAFGRQNSTSENRPPAVGGALWNGSEPQNVPPLRARVRGSVWCYGILFLPLFCELDLLLEYDLLSGSRSQKPGFFPVHTICYGDTAFVCEMLS